MRMPYITSFVPQTSIHLITALSHIFCVIRSHNLFCSIAGLLCCRSGPRRRYTSTARSRPRPAPLRQVGTHAQWVCTWSRGVRTGPWGAQAASRALGAAPVFWVRICVCEMCSLSVGHRQSMNSLIVTYEHKSKEPEKT